MAVLVHCSTNGTPIEEYANGKTFPRYFAEVSDVILKQRKGCKMKNKQITDGIEVRVTDEDVLIAINVPTIAPDILTIAESKQLVADLKRAIKCAEKKQAKRIFKRVALLPEAEIPSVRAKAFQKHMDELAGALRARHAMGKYQDLLGLEPHPRIITGFEAKFKAKSCRRRLRYQSR